MSSRIAARFRALQQEGRAGLVTFVCGGDPAPTLALPILQALVRGGADVIEIGMPFSDPMADGASIQAGNLRALAAGMSLARFLSLVREFRQSDNETPLVLMGYLNPLLSYGPAFAADAVAAGLDGVLLVDLPPEEAGEIDLSGLARIRLATPTTNAARLPAVLDGAEGFLYYVAVAGVTGEKSAGEGEVAAAVIRLKRGSALPVAVGFGVRTPAQAAAVARHADAVVVGSAIVDCIGAAAAGRRNDLPGEVERLVASLAAAVRTARKEPVG